MGQVYMDRVVYGTNLYGSSWLWAEFVLVEFVMDRVRFGTILSWAAMSSYHFGTLVPSIIK